MDLTQTLMLLGFTGELILAVAIYVFPLERRERFPLRLLLCLAAAALLCALVGEVMLWGWLSLTTVLIYLWSLLALWFCFALTWSEALFCWVAGFFFIY